MQAKYTCYFFKYIHRFIIGLCLFAPVEERKLQGKQFNSQAVETLRPEGDLAKYNTDIETNSQIQKQCVDATPLRPLLQTVLSQHFWDFSKEHNKLSVRDTAVNSTFEKRNLVHA